jgi:hypothetical protein
MIGQKYRNRYKRWTKEFIYNLILIIISPNIASVFKKEYNCFNPAREGMAREQEGITREQKGMARKQKEVAREQKRAAREQKRVRKKGPILTLWNSIIIIQC